MHDNTNHVVYQHNSTFDYSDKFLDHLTKKNKEKEQIKVLIKEVATLRGELMVLKKQMITGIDHMLILMS